MHTAVVTILGVEKLSQGRYYDQEMVPRIGEEGHHAYEERTWKNRLHVDANGNVYVPPMCFKNGLVNASKHLNLKIPGENRKTFTKRFESGILITAPLVLPISADEVKGEWLFVPSDGQRGGTRRVNKCFPYITEWGGDITITIMDEKITSEVLLKHFKCLGMFVGIGRFRPERNGFYGRFKVTKMTWDGREFKNPSGEA